MEYYQVLQQHYEDRLNDFGANFKGMDWPNPVDLEKRFQVLTDIIKNTGFQNENISLLDLGCGVGLLLDYFAKEESENKVNYHGVDISGKMISIAKDLHPEYPFEERDILKDPFEESKFDFVIMNGLLTEKQTMSQQEMIGFAQQILVSAYRSCSKGIAFNVMSSHVDWKRDDLFHWELDDLVSFLVKNCSRKIRIMMDYGLYEYTVHLSK